MDSKALTVTATLAVLWFLESVVPEREQFRRRGERLRHDGRHVVVALLNAALGALLLAGMTRWTAEAAAARNIGLRPLLSTPEWTKTLLLLLVLDAWMYLWHRMSHALPFLWRFHRMHHSDPAVDASSALRFHPGEVLISGLLRLPVIAALGLHLGEVALYELIFFPVVLLHHSNVAIPAPLDRALRAVVVTPRMHWVHHSRWKPETDSNYGSVLSVWDRLFRSFRLREHPEEIVFGLEGYDGERAQTVAGLLETPVATFREERGGPPPGQIGA